MQRMKILLVAGFADSVTGFLKKGLSVHVAAPELTTNKRAFSEFKILGL